MSAMHRAALRSRCILVAIAAGASACSPSLPPLGQAIQVDTLAGADAKGDRPIPAARFGPDGAVFFLDARAGALIRRAGTREDTLTAPDKRQRPTSFEWLGDTAVILDANGRAARFYDAAGRQARSIRLGKAFGSAAIDPARKRVYLSVYGQEYRVSGGKFVANADSLVDLVSLSDGRVLRSFGAPRAYTGKHAQILANYVALARHPRTGEVLLAWPFEPVLERFAAEGAAAGETEYALAFASKAARDIAAPSPPFLDVEGERAAFAVAVDSAGSYYLLAAATAVTERSGRTRPPPAQEIQVYGREASPTCRIPLPFFATWVSVAGPGRLLLGDGERKGGIYSVTFRCDAG